MASIPTLLESILNYGWSGFRRLQLGTLLKENLPTEDEKAAIYVPSYDDQNFGLKDLTKGGANDPNVITYRSLKFNEFGVNDELFFDDELPHTYKEGTDLLLHLHWTPRDRATAEDTKTVAWKVDLSIWNVNGTIPSSTTTYNLTATCDGIDHKYPVVTSVPIDGTGLEISASYAGRVYRDTGDTWAGTSSGQLPLLVRVGIHYQIDTFGSASETSKT